ncbi:MAG: hypothetical protein FJ278_20510, partial [Planctomycetes bacterium]|nr:hypothetical protein [Planctomycetota bacterium]
TDWTLCEATLTAPEAASHLTIRMQLCKASGTAWFDDAFIRSPSAASDQRAKPKTSPKPTLGAFDPAASRQRTGAGVEPRTIRVRAEDYLSPEQADAALARAKSAQADALICDVHPDGRLMFPSALLPMPRVVPQGHDPLGYLVEQAHKESIQVIPAFSVFALGRLAADHPDWEVVSADGKLSDDWRRWACPAKTEARGFLVSMVLDALRYDVDGIALDDLRYPDADYCYCDFCRARFRREYGIDPLDIAQNPDKLRSRSEAFRVYLLPFGSERQVRSAKQFVGGMADRAKLGDLKRPGVLVCSDLSASDASAEMVEAMASYVREGGHLVLLDGPVGVGDKFPKFRELVGAAGNCRWLPVDVSFRRDADHPLVADLPDASFGAAGRSLTSPATATVLASFGHVPAILLNKHGNGHVVVFNFEMHKASSAASQALFTKTLEWLAKQSGAKLGKGKLHAARQAWDKWRADQLADFVAKVREGVKKARRDVPIFTLPSP